jgi:hypothetical protein
MNTVAWPASSTTTSSARRSAGRPQARVSATNAIRDGVRIERGHFGFTRL